MKITSFKFFILLAILAFISCTQLPDTPAVVMRVDRELSSAIQFSMILSDSKQPIGIDYGDGVVVKENIDLDQIVRRLKGNIVTIYAHPHSIKSINLQSNSLLTLDVSGSKELMHLQCTDNLLMNLNLSQNTKLQSLVCDFNDLTSLDLSQNEQLINLNGSHNKLSSLDVTGCRNLESIFVEDNKLILLDISTCVSLERLHCSKNRLLTLDIAKNHRMKVVTYADNSLTNISKEEERLLTNLVNPPHVVRSLKK